MPPAKCLLADLRARRISHADFARQGRGDAELVGLIAAELESAYRARREDDLNEALWAAAGVPDRRYTAVLCRIALDREGWLTCQETALEILEDIDDPAALDPMVELCCRPDLVFDLDWRKAVLIILGRSNDRARVEAGLEAIVRSRSPLTGEAARWLEHVRRLHRP